MKISFFGIRSTFILVTAMTLTGCGHYTMRGSVVENESDDEAQICMGDQEVKAGDKVVLYKSVCPPPVYKASHICYKKRIGAGAVTRTLNEHMSIIKVEPNVEFKEGTIVEKE